MRLPPLAVSRIEEARGLPGCHSDPVLLSQPRAYARLVKRCLNIRLVSLTDLQHEAELGIFFVHKKGGRQRLILDCRRTNARFVRPPGVELLSSYGLGKIEARGHLRGIASHLGVGDVADCFHRLRLGGGIRRYVCWPSIKAKYLG